ncbi:MAG: hypothetical protein JXR94_11220 [Candidatus Hydrogenedentes bacterium]|nr:hypothetical protein [Candidatus Hydrogenedentota bacterium]
MERALYMAGFAVLALAAALLAANAVRSPVEARHAAFEDLLAGNAPSAPHIRVTPDLEYADVHRAISAQPKLWMPLVEAPPPEKQAPDMAKLLQGVEVTRDKMGSGETLKVRIRAGKDDRRGQWMGKGDKLKGMVIKAITDDAVVFGLTKDGVEYTHPLPRPTR